MAKKIKFALKLKDGAEVRTLEELRQAFDLEAVIGYWSEGKLGQWLKDRYYEEEAEAVGRLNKDTPEFCEELCKALQVPYEREETVDVEELELRRERLRRLKEVTEDEEILSKVDQVAFDQEELADRLDEGWDVIYLCGKDFHIPEKVGNRTYIPVHTKLDIDERKLRVYRENGIQIVGVSDQTGIEEPRVEVKDRGTLGEALSKIRVICKNYENTMFLCRMIKMGENDGEILGISGIKIDLEHISTFGKKQILKCSAVGDTLIYRSSQKRGIAIWNLETGKLREMEQCNVEKQCYNSKFILQYGEEVLENTNRNVNNYSFVLGRGLGFLINSISRKIIRIPIQDGREEELNVYSCNYEWAGNEKGFYSISLSNNETIKVLELLNDESEVREYKFLKNEKIQCVSTSTPWICADKRDGNIYSCMGESIVMFDVREKQLKIIQENCQDGFSLIHIESGKMFFTLIDGLDLSVMDIKTGERRYLWEGLQSKIVEMTAIDDYIVFYCQGNTDRLFMVRKDGSEKTILRRAMRNDDPNILQKPEDIIEIEGICKMYI